MAAQRRKKKHGEDCLSHVESITLIMENEVSVTFEIASELGISDTDVGLAQDATTSAARYAFWAYQTERALLTVKECERDTADFEACTYLAWRKDGLLNHGGLPTEGYLRSMLDADRQVRRKREKLADVRHEYAIVRAVRDAVAKRHEILRTLTMRLRSNSGPASQH